MRSITGRARLELEGALPWFAPYEHDVKGQLDELLDYVDAERKHPCEEDPRRRVRAGCILSIKGVLHVFFAVAEGPRPIVLHIAAAEHTAPSSALPWESECAPAPEEGWALAQERLDSGGW